MSPFLFIQFLPKGNGILVEPILLKSRTYISLISIIKIRAHFTRSGLCNDVRTCFGEKTWHFVVPNY
jgi:hypothetical protein